MLACCLPLAHFAGGKAFRQGLRLRNDLQQAETAKSEQASRASASCRQCCCHPQMLLSPSRGFVTIKGTQRSTGHGAFSHSHKHPAPCGRPHTCRAASGSIRNCSGLIDATAGQRLSKSMPADAVWWKPACIHVDMIPVRRPCTAAAAAAAALVRP
jgi:hypothetical protein